jgi:hypothetical protein
MDFAILLKVAQNYQRQGTFAQGDLNADGIVNFDDLLILAQNYNGHLAAAAAPAAAAATSAPLDSTTVSRKRAAVAPRRPQPVVRTR